MKKILLILFCMILLTGTISALEFDNIGRYNETLRTFTIKNSILGIPFLQLGTIAEIHLETPDVVHVPRGKNKTVAEFTINNYGDYSNAFKKMEFYHINKEMKKFEREFTYRYEKSLGFETINDYETICDDKIFINGSKYKDCYKELIGTHQEEIFEWVEFDNSKELPTGEITIRIFIDVYAGDKVEWIPTLFGVRIDEWAVWSEDMDVNLLSYYALNETSGVVVDGTGDYNGTNVGATRGVTGKIDNAFDFEQDENDRFNFTQHNFNDFTVNLWMSPEGAFGVNFGHVFSDRSGHDRAFIATSTVMKVQIDSPNIYDFAISSHSGVWRMYTFTRDGTNLSMFTNGSFISSSVSVADIFSIDNFAWKTDDPSAVKYFDGKMDEIGIWNRALTSTEVTELWNGGNGLNYYLRAFEITLNYPIDNYNSTDPTIIFNGTVLILTDLDLVNVSLYINGILNETNSSGIDDTDYIFTKRLLDGDYNWTYEACDNESNCLNSTTRNFNINTTPNIQFENPTPINEYNSSVNNFIANVSLTETYFDNLTFYLYNQTDLVDSTTYTDSTRHINWTDLPDGKYSYNATIWTNTSQHNSTETRNINIDIVAPEINITYPTAVIDHHIVNTNLSLNWTVTDLNLDSCWYDYNGTNVSVTCSDNTTQINTTEYSNRNVTFYANDTFGNLNSDYQEWEYKIFEIKQTFSPTTIEGSTETYISNIFLGNGETITEIIINYNGTDKSAGYLSLGGNEYNLSSTFIVPSVTAETNITFFWKVILVSGQVNTSSRNQTVKSIDIDDCSVFTNTIFNYTIVDEEFQTKITNKTLLELDLEMFDETKTVSILNFSEKYDNVNPALVCLSIELTNDTVYAVDSTVKYEAYEAKNYSIEYYNIQNFLLQNSTIPQNIILFDLLLIDSTEFQVTFKDSNFVAVENALIQINRQYLSEGLFKTVEIPKTDSNGQTVAHLVEKDVVYNIVVLKEGEVLGTFNNVVAFCEDILIGSCFISLNALIIGEISFDYDEDIGLFFDFDYNETTRDLQFDFSTTDGSVKNVTLSALKIDQLGNTTVCDGFLISSSGSILCPVPVSVGNETIIVSIFVDGDLKITNYVQAGREFDIGDAGYFLMFFLVLSLALMMTQSKTGVIVGVVIGFISGIFLSFIQGGLLGIGSSAIWLIIMGIILIYKLNKEGQT